MVSQLTERSQVNKDIQIKTQIFEQKNNERIEKMKIETEKDLKLETIVKKIRSSKSVSTRTNLRSESNETQSMQAYRSKNDTTISVLASANENSKQEDEDYPPKASAIKYLWYPAKPLYRNERYLDTTKISNEDSEEEDYHSWGRKRAQRFSYEGSDVAPHLTEDIPVTEALSNAWLQTKICLTTGLIPFW